MTDINNHLDGVSQCATNPMELDLTREAATHALRRALHVYVKARLRPRKAGAWAYVQCELWNARQDALRTGALKRHTEQYSHVSECYSEATRRWSWARTLEGQGNADVRV